ncbi:MAG: prepilin-type N-terminal cleavage/methylation domain-containing protein [Clostridia bacterium]|nr:prepilin-type N-terminal cleavage/methylation domain-containing protein [Clostridia bacterium]
MKKNNKGFSLVELIVVIAIMAILAGIAVVSYSIYIQKAEDAADEEYLNNLLYRVELFALENQMNVHGVMIPNVIDEPDDIRLIIGYENDSPIYYNPNLEGNVDSSVIFEEVGGHEFGSSYQNGIYETNSPLFPEWEDKVTGGTNDHEHVYADTPFETVPSTCIAQGYMKFRCNSCDAVKESPLPMGNHTLEVKSSFGNYQVKVCSVCRFYILENINGTPIVDMN